MAEKTIASIDGFVLLVDKGPDDGKSQIIFKKDGVTMNRTADLPEIVEWSEPYHPFPGDPAKGKYTNVDLTFERNLSPTEREQLQSLFRDVRYIGVSGISGKYKLHIRTPENGHISIKTE